MPASSVEIQSGVAIGPIPNVCFAISMSQSSSALSLSAASRANAWVCCFSRQVICSYPKSRKPRDYQANTQMSLGIRKPSASRSASNTPTDRQETDQSVSEISATDLLATRFLDPDVFHRMRLELPKPDLAVTKAMTDQAGSILDIQEIARSYFDTVHTWMPIISKKQFNENLLNRLSHRRCELFLLILSMKLSCARVSMPKTVLYRTVKQLHSEIESAGVLSVAVLQASILIAIYELGHAMYPAVLLSVGRCARYAAIIGIDKRARPPRTMNLPWMEEEECCRIWWSIVILDRSVFDAFRQSFSSLGPCVY